MSRLQATSKQRLNLQGIPTRTHDLQTARRLVDRGGMMEILSPLLYGRPGRRRRDDLYGVLVCAQLNALQENHTGELIDIAKVANGLTSKQRRQIGLERWTEPQSYDRVQRLFGGICQVDGPVGVVGGSGPGLDTLIDHLCASHAEASVPHCYRRSRSCAIDGTDIPTWGRPHFGDSEITLDGEPGPSDDEANVRGRQATRRIRSLATGPDKRAIYTADPDARGGHRSATATRKAGKFVGYETHTAVQTRDATIHDPVLSVVLGDAVPPVILSYALVEAGGPRPSAALWMLDRARTTWPVTDVIVDRGYTQSPERFQLPARKLGLQVFQDLMGHQRGPRPTDGFVTQDGWPFSLATPDAVLRETLDVPPRGTSEDDRQSYQQRFEDRARFAWSPHSRPDHRGKARFKGPLAKGRLKHPRYPETMRRPISTPEAVLPEGWQDTWDRTRTIDLAELPLYQPVLYGTRAWHAAYVSRRQPVESGNAGLKRAGASIAERGHFKVMGRAKITLLLAFEVAAYNVKCIDAFERHRPQRTQPGPRPDDDDEDEDEDDHVEWSGVVRDRPDESTARCRGPSGA